MTDLTQPSTLSEQFTEREMRLAVPAIRALRECRSKREAINVVALIAKTVIEAEPRRAFYEWSDRMAASTQDEGSDSKEAICE